MGTWHPNGIEHKSMENGSHGKSVYSKIGPLIDWKSTCLKTNYFLVELGFSTIIFLNLKNSSRLWETTYETHLTKYKLSCPITYSVRWVPHKWFHTITCPNSFKFEQIIIEDSNPVSTHIFFFFYLFIYFLFFWDHIYVLNGIGSMQYSRKWSRLNFFDLMLFMLFYYEYIIKYIIRCNNSEEI
jgi:hypothetical protein